MYEQETEERHKLSTHSKPHAPERLKRPRSKAKTSAGRYSSGLGCRGQVWGFHWGLGFIGHRVGKGLESVALGLKLRMFSHSTSKKKT